METSAAQLARSKELLAAGSIAASDYAQIEAQYSNDQYNVTMAENTLTLNKLQLKQLLELEPTDSFPIGSLPDRPRNHARNEKQPIERGIGTAGRKDRGRRSLTQHLAQRIRGHEP